MNLLTPLLGRKAAPELPPPAPAAAAERAPNDRPLGCGWFDSSHELQSGLLVREHASPDTLATELPLSSWLELHLGSWRFTQAS